MTPSLGPVPTLDQIAEDPAKAATLPTDVARSLWVRGHIALGALAPYVAMPADQQEAAEVDRLLDIEQATEKLSVTKDWLYRHAAKLPFTVRLSPGKVRFSLRGIEKYIRQRQGR